MAGPRCPGTRHNHPLSPPVPQPSTFRGPFKTKDRGQQYLQRIISTYFYVSWSYFQLFYRWNGLMDWHCKQWVDDSMGGGNLWTNAAEFFSLRANFNDGKKGDLLLLQCCGSGCFLAIRIRHYLERIRILPSSNKKKYEKPWFMLLCDLFFVNIHTKSNKQKKLWEKKNIFFGILEASDEKSRIRIRPVVRIRGSVSVPKCHGATTLFSSIVILCRPYTVQGE